MITPSTYHIAEKSVPEHIRVSAPKFVDFLKTYYKFMLDYDVELNTLKDVDLVAEELLLFLKKEFAPRFPQAKIDDRKLIPLLNYIFKTKGTGKSIELLFRIFFEDVISIDNPSKNILRASDGKWQQLSFITVDKTFGEVPVGEPNTKIRVETQGGSLFIDLVKSEQISNTKFRLYFNKTTRITFTPSQKIDIYVGDEFVFRGNLIKSPARLAIGQSGKFWRKGQIISLPGTQKNSVVSIRDTTSTGGLKRVEIIDFGFENTENEIFVFYPIPKPPSADFELEIETVGYDPLTETFINNYTLTLNEDIGQGITDSGVAISDIKNANSYFLEDYVEEFYVGAIVASWSSEVIPDQPFINLGGNYTYADWVASRTSLSLIYDWVSSLPGSYFDNSGHISDQYIRLQDNFFYQLFSYVINTQIQIDEFRPILNLVHPAGYKAFGNLLKIGIFEAEYSSYRRITTDYVFVDESLEVTEANEKHVELNKEDEVTHTITNSFEINKNIFDSSNVVDSGYAYDEGLYFAGNYMTEKYTEDSKSITIG
jgi:hypothetical protein